MMIMIREPETATRTAGAGRRREDKTCSRTTALLQEQAPSRRSCAAAGHRHPLLLLRNLRRRKKRKRPAAKSSARQHTGSGGEDLAAAAAAIDRNSSCDDQRDDAIQRARCSWANLIGIILGGGGAAQGAAGRDDESIAKKPARQQRRGGRQRPVSRTRSFVEDLAMSLLRRRRSGTDVAASKHADNGDCGDDSATSASSSSSSLAAPKDIVYSDMPTRDPKEFVDDWLVLADLQELVRPPAVVSEHRMMTTTRDGGAGRGWSSNEFDTTNDRECRNSSSGVLWTS